MLWLEYRITVQAGFSYGEVSDTWLDGLRLAQGDLLVVASTSWHHGISSTPPPPPTGCHTKGVMFTHWTLDN